MQRSHLRELRKTLTALSTPCWQLADSHYIDIFIYIYTYIQQKSISSVRSFVYSNYAATSLTRLRPQRNQFVFQISPSAIVSSSHERVMISNFRVLIRATSRTAAALRLLFSIKRKSTYAMCSTKSHLETHSVCVTNVLLILNVRSNRNRILE